MTTTTETDTTAEFLAGLWGAKDGAMTGVHFITELTGKGMQHHPVASVREAVNKATAISDAGGNAYFACGAYATPENRKADNVSQAHAFWLDIDCGDTKAATGNGYTTKRAAATAVAEFCKTTSVQPPTALIDSGNGLHVYWLLDAPIDAGKWTAVAKKLKALTAKHGLLADPSRTADRASVLRVPGTINRKDPANPKPVTLKRMTGPVSFAEFKAAIEGAIPDEAEASGPNAALTGGLEQNRLQPLAETPENVERVRSMLRSIPADCDRGQWRDVVWSILSTGWPGAVELAREWSMTGGEKYDVAEFDKLVASHNPAGGIGFGTLVHHAKANAWVEPDSIEGERFTGSGGDVANGKLFARAHRNKLLFVHETSEVLKFDAGAGWVSAPPGEEDRAAKQVLAKLRDVAAERYKAEPDAPNTKRLMAHVERTSKAQNLRAMVDMAKSEPGMTVGIGEFDNDPMLLGVANGVLDLRSGQLHTISPGLLVSKRCAVEFDGSAECPTFMRFLARVQPEKEMQEFIQRWAGYCLTGSVQEQKFSFLYGGGANGKSVFVELMARLLGDYSRKIATEMLMHHQRNPQGPSPDIVALKGRRFVYANETEEGRRLAEARIKDMTGGDTMTGRVPYGKADITFTPTHKLVIVGNHRPEITDNSFGMWRRVALVPFEVTIPEGERDARLLDTLMAEGAGILNWALEGLRAWRQGGLEIPAKIEAATAAYRDEQDVIGDWISDHCDIGAGRSERKQELYRAYRAWALANGHHPLAQGRLTRRLGDRGHRLQSDKRTIGGLSLNPKGRTCG
jgi:putative DNA primase/helicase